MFSDGEKADEEAGEILINDVDAEVCASYNYRLIIFITYQYWMTTGR